MAERTPAVLISEDHWTSALWPGELLSLEDYRDRSRRLRGVLWPHVLALLSAKTSIVLEFAANTRGQRASLADLVREADADHILHFIDTPAQVCWNRVKARNEAVLHPYAPSHEQFLQIGSLFEPPTSEEGFNIVRHGSE